ncbi:DUF4430 domain-containing protein [Oenococcus oeni]
MKKKIAKIISLILVVVAVILFGFSYAGNKSNGKGTQIYSIPKNGIITKSDLKKIKKNGGIAIYKGSNDGVNYEWTFVGSDIKKTSAVNLKVLFNSDHRATMKKQASGKKIFSFSPVQKGVLPGKPSLSITVGNDWTYGTYKLYSFASNIATSAGNIQVVKGLASLQFKKNNGGWYFFTKGKILSSSTSEIVSKSKNKSSKSLKKGDSKSSKTKSQTEDGNSFSSKKNDSSSAVSASSANATNGSSTPAPDPNPPTPSKTKTIQVTISIQCHTAVTNWNKLSTSKKNHKVVPANGIILPVTKVTVAQGYTVYDLLVKICEEKGIQMQHEGDATYDSQYIEGINNLYEFDCGQLSGWMYEVNGWYPNYGCSQYVLKNNDVLVWNYTCDLGRDLGASSTTY